MISNYLRQPPKSIILHQYKLQTQAILRLQNHPDLEIKAADKGGNVVLMTKLNYEKMAFNILRNKKWYACISESHTKQFKTAFLNIIGSAF